MNITLNANVNRGHEYPLSHWSTKSPASYLQILIVLGLFLILLCCLLQRVSDLDAVHLPRNSYLLITVTYSLIIQLQWLRQKCFSHHFSGCGDQYHHRCQGDGAVLTVASLWQHTSKLPLSEYLINYNIFDSLPGFSILPLSCLEHCVKKFKKRKKKAWLTLTWTCLANYSQAWVIMSSWCHLLFFLLNTNWCTVYTIFCTFNAEVHIC